jgi:hypothetical protein
MHFFKATMVIATVLGVALAQPPGYPVVSIPSYTLWMRKADAFIGLFI